MKQSKKVIDIVLLRRVLVFYLTTILETGTDILLLIGVKNTGRPGHSIEFRKCSGGETSSSEERICCSELSTGEGNDSLNHLCSSVPRGKKLFRGEFVFGALLFSGEGNWYSTVLERTGTLLHCFQKEFSIILFSGEYSPLFSG